MRDAEIHAAAPGEHFMTDRALHRIRVALGLLLGKIDADLHRSAGMHRVEATEQGFAHRYHADEVVENATQLLFTARSIQAGAVAFAVGRVELQRTAHQQAGNVCLRGATVDLVAGDLAQARYARINLKGRLLFGHGQNRAQVLRGRRDVLRGKRHLNVCGPTLGVGGFGRQQSHNLSLHLGRTTRRRFLGPLTAATGQYQQSGDAEDQSIGLHVVPSSPWVRLNHTSNVRAAAMTVVHRVPLFATETALKPRYPKSACAENACVPCRKRIAQRY
ncbi:hypothetical protein D3C81_811330 [compost metagenome]